MSDGAYFQFPLCLLAFRDNVESRLRTIVDYCVVEVGQKLRTALDKKVEASIVGTYEGRPIGFRKGDWQHRSIVIGMHRLNVTGGDVDTYRKLHEEAYVFIQRMGPKQPTVRVKAEYVWQVIAGGGMSYREFSVLAGIYAIIGDKIYPTLIRRERIRAAAMGYKSAAMLQDAELLKTREDGAVALTINQLRTTIDNLEVDGHFARCHASARCTYFSNRMDRKELLRRIFEWKTKKARKLADNRDGDAKLQGMVRGLNSPRNHHSNKEAEPARNESPRNHHAVTTEPPRDHHSNRNLILQKSSSQKASLQGGEPLEKEAEKLSGEEKQDRQLAEIESQIKDVEKCADPELAKAQLNLLMKRHALRKKELAP